MTAVQMDRRAVLEQFEPFFKVWYPHLLRYVCRYISPRETAEEVVQEVFLDLYKAFGAGTSIEFPKAWTIRVARRKCAELRRRPLHVDLDQVDARDSGDLSSNPAESLDRGLDTARLRGCLSLLTDREEQVLLLRLQSMKFREIGSSLGITTSSVNTLLARALEKLQDAFGERRESSRARGRHEA
jgi:RNA polymerase sigma-70 factor (ECF subfamily)